MPVPVPTPIYRIMHSDNLRICLRRGGLHAANHAPDDGLTYKTVHNVDIQSERRFTPIDCGPGGVIHDYVSFYFGPRSPMLFQLHTGRVPGYSEGQRPIIYLVSTVQRVHDSEAQYVFSDGHGIAAFTRWFDDIHDLDQVDWDAVNARYWSDTVEDMDRQRRKQAEFLVYRFCDWSLIRGIGVFDRAMKARTQSVMGTFPEELHRVVRICPEWYY
jgi:hypothetical protein